MKSTILKHIILAGLWLSNSVFALNVPQEFNYQGLLKDSLGRPLTGTVAVGFQILNANGTCVLYEEVQNSVNLSLTHGVFNVRVGSAPGSAKRSANDPGLDLKTVFTNGKSVLAAGKSVGCASGFQGADGEGRKLRVTVYDRTSSSWKTVTPDHSLASVPTALVAESLQGLTVQDFDQRYVSTTRLGQFNNGELCRADGDKIVCDRTLSSMTGQQGEKGAKGDKGDKGDKGEKGDNGAKGADGSNIIVKAVNPIAADGKNGDLFLNQTSQELFRKTAGVWTRVTHLKGANGKDGKDGANGRGFSALNQSCPAGQYLKGITASGALNCKPLKVAIETEVVESKEHSMLHKEVYATCRPGWKISSCGFRLTDWDESDRDSNAPDYSIPTHNGCAVKAGCLGGRNKFAARALCQRISLQFE